MCAALLAFSRCFATAINPRRSLKAKLGLAIGGITLILSILASLTVGYTASRYVEANIGQSLAELAYQITDKLDRGMFERYRDIQILSTLAPIQDPNTPASAKREFLEKLQFTYPDYAWIGLTNEQGRVLVSTGKVLEGKNVSKRPWFQGAQANPYVGDVHEALLLAKILPNRTGESLRLVDVAAPVSDRQGNFLGVLAAHLNWTWASEVQKSLLQAAVKHNSVEVLILSKNGTVLLGSPELESQQLSLASVKAASTGQNGYVVENWSNGKSYLTGFAQSRGYRNYPGLGWLVLVRQKSDIAFTPARQLQHQISILTMTLGVVLASVGWIIADAIAKPMLAITTTADRIRRGNTTSKIPVVRGRDEIAVLSNSLNQLVHTLIQQEQELQASNQRLQTELHERTSAQKALKESEERFRIAARSGSDLIYEWDISSGSLEWFGNIDKHLGYDSGEFPRTLEAREKIIHPEDRDRVAAAVKRHLETQKPYFEEYRIQRKDGSWLYWTDRGTAFWDKNGNPYKWIGVNTDISDRKRAEAELQESHSILRAVIEASTDSIFMKDVQGRYVTINSAGANVIGKPVEDIVGKNDTELFPYHIAQPIIEDDRNLIASQVNQTYEHIIPFRGELRTFMAVRTVCRDEQGKVIGIVGVARDISDRKHAEQQIRELNQDLERRVLERTAQLEASNKELEAFCYSVSHDLRTPLRSIDGFSLALLERYASELDDKGKHYLQRVRAATQRMGQLIEDLLNLSRVTRTPMQRDCVDLTATVQAIAVELQHTQPERTVKFDIAPAVVAQGDPRLLRVVLENLLNNAWKFTSKTVQPRISFGTTVEQDGLVTYFVTDNGAGFDMAYADKLFGAFQRLHTEQEFPGTGIGLATVARIVHRHGGRVWAEGAIDQGARFYFTL